MRAFEADGRGGAVAGQHLCVVAQGKQLLHDGLDQLRIGAAGEIGTTDRPQEQRVTDEGELIDHEGHTSEGVTRRVQHPRLATPDGDVLARDDLDIDFGGLHLRQAEHPGLNGQTGDERAICGVQREGNTQSPGDGRDGSRVVEVSVGIEDPVESDASRLHPGEDEIGLTARVDQNARHGGVIPGQEAVLFEGTVDDGFKLDGHGRSRSTGSRSGRTPYDIRPAPAVTASALPAAAEPGRAGYRREYRASNSARFFCFCQPTRMRLFT